MSKFYSYDKRTNAVQLINLPPDYEAALKRCNETSMWLDKLRKRIQEIVGVPKSLIQQHDTIAPAVSLSPTEPDYLIEEDHQ
jgi:hypothetical protein